MTARQIIGQTIRARRQLHGYTRDKLADMLVDDGYALVSAQTIARWEMGNQPIPADAIIYLSHVLGCTSCSLLGDLEHMHDEKRIVIEYNNLTELERSIVHYLAYKWKGNVHCLLWFCLLYALLPKFYRQKIVRKGINLYCEAQENNELETTDAPCQVKLQHLVDGWHSLRKNAGMHNSNQ